MPKTDNGWPGDGASSIYALDFEQSPKIDP